MANTFTPEQIAQILEEFFKVVGTRQYIGARYVPIFGRKDEDSIEWDNTAPYEPLTIVLYQGNSYTSRQYVPVGVEIANQEFWAITGNYNAQIEQYRRETAAAQTDIDTLLPKVAFSSENTIKKYIDENTTRVIAFDVVKTLKEAAYLKEGMICCTQGFYENGDGGAAYYLIMDSGPRNDMDVIELDNGLFAHLVTQDNRVNVKQLGCVGDGTTDESQLLSHALVNYDYIDIYETVGITTVDITGLSDKTIDGHFAGTLKSVNRERTIISTDILNTSSSANNFVFQNLNLIGSGYYDGLTSARQFSDSGIRIYHGGMNNVIRNCTFTNFGCVALSLDGDNSIVSENVIGCNIEFTGDYSPLNYNFGIHVNGNNVIVEGNKVTDCIQCVVTGDVFNDSHIVNNNLKSKIQHCIYVEGGSNNVVDGNVIDASNGINGIKVQNAPAMYETPIENVIVSNNVIKGAGDQGIIIAQLGTNGYCANIAVVNNIVENSSRAIMLLRCADSSIKGNHCTAQTDKYGIYVQSCNDISISGNNISGANSGWGIYLTTSNWLIISDNTFHNLMFCIFTGDGNNVIISNNTCNKFSTGIHIPAPAALSTIRILSNSFVLDSDIYGSADGTHNTAIFIVRSNDVSIVGNSFEKIGDAVADGIYAQSVTTQFNLAANVTEGFRWGFRRPQAVEDISHADANIWNTNLIG